jgi:hypothetical protein
LACAHHLGYFLAVCRIGRFGRHGSFVHSLVLLVTEACSKEVSYVLCG